MAQPVKALLDEYTRKRKRVAEVVVDEAKNRVPVIVHMGAIGTKLSIELAEHAEIGADAISSVPPFYWQFRRNRSFNIIVILAMLVTTHDCLQCPALSVLARSRYHLSVSANKECWRYQVHLNSSIPDCSNPERVRQKFRVYSGVDEMAAIFALIAGVDGLIGSFYNVLPEIYLNLVKAVTHNKMEEASRLQNIASLIVQNPSIGRCPIRHQGYSLMDGDWWRSL